MSTYLEKVEEMITNFTNNISRCNGFGIDIKVTMNVDGDEKTIYIPSDCAYNAIFRTVRDIKYNGSIVFEFDAVTESEDLVLRDFRKYRVVNGVLILDSYWGNTLLTGMLA